MPFKTALFFPSFSVFAVMKKQKNLGGGILQAVCGLKAKSERKRIFFKNVTALLCTWSRCVRSERKMCCILVCFKGHYWSIIHWSLLSYPLFFCIPSFLSILQASFIKVLRSKGAAAAWGRLGSWRFDLWPSCYSTMPSISTQFTTAIWAKADQNRGDQWESMPGIQQQGFIFAQRGGVRLMWAFTVP